MVKGLAAGFPKLVKSRIYGHSHGCGGRFMVVFGTVKSYLWLLKASGATKYSSLITFHHHTTKFYRINTIFCNDLFYCRPSLCFSESLKHKQDFLAHCVLFSWMFLFFECFDLGYSCAHGYFGGGTVPNTSMDCFFPFVPNN